MGGNSFLLRGWSITLISVFSGFAFEAETRVVSVYFLSIAIFLVTVFWLLDSYYLSQERSYRSLYNEVRKKPESSIDFSLDASGHQTGRNSWGSSMFSTIFVVFYLPVLVGLLLISSRFIGIDIFIR